MHRKISLSLIVICQTFFYTFALSLSEQPGTEILYKLNWPGKIEIDLSAQPQDGFEYYPITTSKKEKYVCKIPTAEKEKKASEDPYTGPNPIELLSPLFNQKFCSFKTESYWTYEICHGRYVRQFHEEREGKNVKMQQFFLGRMNKTETTALLEEYSEREKKPENKPSLPTKKFDGIRIPYVEMKMSNGTVCDISNKPRTIRLQYICHPQGKHEVYSLDEVSSCEYVAVIVSPLLCMHPDYPRGAGESEIDCIPVDKSPKRPRALAALEAESLKIRHQKMKENLQKLLEILSVNKKVKKDTEARLRVELRPADALEKNGNEFVMAMLDSNSGRTDVSPVSSFLSGKHCLHGGNGWWKYEFCYGRSVVQYHTEKNGAKITIDLGKFDKKKHIEWVEARPHRRPKPLSQRKQISHFYSDGSLCEKTGKPRQTEVKLKCDDNPASSPSSVSLFLLEPKTCEYILGVESPLICSILEYADNDGLISESAIMDLNSSKSTPTKSTSDSKASSEKKSINDEL